MNKFDSVKTAVRRGYSVVPAQVNSKSPTVVDWKPMQKSVYNWKTWNLTGKAILTTTWRL